MKMLLAALSALILTPAASAQPQPQPLLQAQAGNPAEQRVRGHVEFLASDLLEGRETGTRGYDLAAAYVAAEYRKLGLQPGGDDGGWLQQVPFRLASHASPPTVSITFDGAASLLASGRDFGLRPSLVEKQTALNAGLLFVGHGISDPMVAIDDYAGLDARGKIVVVLPGTPTGLPRDVAVHLNSVKREVAGQKGAVGFIELSREGNAPNGDRALSYFNRQRTNWVDPSGRAGRSGGAVRAELALSRAWQERLFQGAPRSLAQIREQAGADRPVAGFPLAASMTIRAQSAWQDFTSPNVIGVLPGSDPELRGEHIVLMGHLDHLGINANAKPGEDAIRNGALDNAAGIATMIEAARSFVAAGQSPRRSILFIANTGEEKGLLGADYFAAHPSVPLDSLVGLVNLDMPLLLYDFTDVIAFGGEHSTIGETVAEAAGAMNVAVTPDPMPEQSLFVRSDHYPLVLRGVPSVFLMTGHGNGGEQAWKDFLGKAYHRPNDDLAQPIDWRAAARFAELNYRIARTLANAPERAAWYRDSYFGQAYAPAAPKAER